MADILRYLFSVKKIQELKDPLAGIWLKLMDTSPACSPIFFKRETTFLTSSVEPNQTASLCAVKPCNHGLCCLQSVNSFFLTNGLPELRN